MFTYLKWYAVNDTTFITWRETGSIFSYVGSSWPVHFYPPVWTNVTLCYFPLRVVQHIIHITLKL